MPSSVVGTLTKGTGLAKGALVVDGGGASLVSAQDAGRCRTMQDETGRRRRQESQIWTLLTSSSVRACGQTGNVEQHAPPDGQEGFPPS